MTTRHTPGTTGMSGTAAPWQERQLSSGAKLGLLTLAALLLIILLVSLLVFIGVGGAFLRGETDPQERTADIIGLAVVAGLFFAGLAGLIFVWPRAQADTRFTPGYGVIPPTSTGHPFEVRFRRYLWGRSLRGNGTIQFDSDHLVIAGHLEPHALFQLGIVLVLTFLPLLLFGFGLGIIPALIIAYYVGRKRMQQTIGYHAIRDLTVKGSRVTFHSDTTPRQTAFSVAGVDGERLYRELLLRFPADLGGWQG